jgi:hypothetical protein
MPKFIIKDSPAIYVGKKLTRSAMKVAGKQDSYAMIVAYILVAPLKLLEAGIKVLNTKLEAYLERQKSSNSKST